MLRRNVFILLATLIVLSCKEEVVVPESVLFVKETVLNFSKSAEIKTIDVTTNVSDWDVVSSDTEWCKVSKKTVPTPQIIVMVTENNGIDSRSAEVTVSNNSLSSTIKVTQMGTSSEVEVPKDVKIAPTGGKANQYQPGQNIENTFDGVFGGEPYHSPWGNNTKFPVILEYFFDVKVPSPAVIDYLIYYTRSGNGNFGKLKLYVATKDNPEYSLYDNYDFKETSSPSKISFANGLKNPTKIKFEVLSGLGGFASCDQMEFYSIKRDDALSEMLLSVFKDVTCSELKDGVTTEQINNIHPFFGSIAMSMKQNSYPRDFRISEFPAYSIVEDWAEKLVMNPRGVLDNCTGIYAEANEELIVLVGNTHGNQLKLRSISETESHGDDYMLNEGINKIKIRKKGLLYILYNVGDLKAATSKPVKIHIPMQCGTVNGYWSLDDHKSDAKYKELLNNATYPYFEVRGTHIMFKLPTDKYKEIIPNNILPTIEFWDEMVDVQHAIMGLDVLYPSQMNNRMYARSTKDGYMSAQPYQTNYAESTLYKILPPSEILKDEDNAWGPAHEIGHMHQGAINWKGNTETSNNLFSNLVRYKMTKFLSRGESMEEINKRHVVDKRVFTDYGGDIGIPSLRMQWQLYCYFHILNNNQKFFPKLFEISREAGRRPIDSNPGWSQLNYVRNASDAAKLNLLDFFEFWGFLTPVDMEVDQYGKGQLKVTQQMIDETKSYVVSKGYNKPAQIIQYIEDRDPLSYGNVGKMNKHYKENLKITKQITYKMNSSNTTITINKGEEAVGFEVRDGSKLKFFSNKYSFTIPSDLWNTNCKIFAIQANGDSIEVNKLD